MFRRYEEALRQIHPSLTFLKEVDRRSGYRTKQMLVAPIMDGNSLHGVLQVINNKNDEPFGDLEVDGVTELCKTLAGFLFDSEEHLIRIDMSEYAGARRLASCFGIDLLQIFPVT